MCYVCRSLCVCLCVSVCLCVMSVFVCVYVCLCVRVCVTPACILIRQQLPSDAVTVAMPTPRYAHGSVAVGSLLVLGSGCVHTLHTHRTHTHTHRTHTGHKHRTHTGHTISEWVFVCT